MGAINPGISLNRFAYANRNPVSLTDPFGLSARGDSSLVTRIGNLLGGLDDGFIDNGLSALQFLATFGGESDAGSSLDNARNPFAKAGFYDPNSAIAKGGVSIANNVAADLTFALFDNPAGAAKGLGGEIGILKGAAQGKGNFGLGSASASDAMRLGQSWIGEV